MLHAREVTKIYDVIIKMIAIILALIGFSLLCAGIRWQIVMNDFLLAHGF